MIPVDLHHRAFTSLVSAPKGRCPGVPVHEGIPIVFITIHGVMTQFVNVSFFCVPVHEDTTPKRMSLTHASLFLHFLPQSSSSQVLYKISLV